MYCRTTAILKIKKEENQTAFKRSRQNLIKIIIRKRKMNPSNDGIFFAQKMDRLTLSAASLKYIHGAIDSKFLSFNSYNYVYLM